MPMPAVTAGDLITADLMNQIIQKLNQLESASTPSVGNINVPALVGMKLSAARSVIISPITQLSLGFVIDAGGNSVDLSSLPALEKIVINQAPPGGAKVTAGTAVNLVVSGGTGGGGVTVISVTADSAPIRVGMRITVHGTNFAQPASLNSVLISGTAVQPSAFTFSSNDTQLIFDVPSVPNLADSGTLVTLTVTNSNGTSNPFPFMLSPAQQLPQGRIETRYTAPPVMLPGQTVINANQSYVFIYAVRAFVNLAETYQLAPAIGAAGWSAEVLQDVSDQALVPPRILIPGGNPAERTVRIRVNIPNGATGSALLNFNVTATNPGAAVPPGVASPETITVGQPPPTPEPRVRISLRPGANIQNGRVMFNATNGVNFTISVTEPAPAGTAPYIVNGTTVAGGWTITKNSISLPGGGTTQAIAAFNATTATDQAPANQNVTAVLTPGSGAGNTDLILTVTRATTPAVNVSYALPIGFSAA